MLLECGPLLCQMKHCGRDSNHTFWPHSLRARAPSTNHIDSYLSTPKKVMLTLHHAPYDIWLQCHNCLTKPICRFYDTEPIFHCYHKIDGYLGNHFMCRYMLSKPDPIRSVSTLGLGTEANEAIEYRVCGTSLGSRFIVDETD